MCTLSRHEFMAAYLEKLRELDLFDDFIDACGNIYYDILEKWAKKWIGFQSGVELIGSIS